MPNISKDDQAFDYLVPVDADRSDAFDSAFTLLGRLDYENKLTRNIAARVRGGLSWTFIFKSDVAQGNLYYDYGFQIRYEHKPIDLSGGFSGRLLLTDDRTATETESYHPLVLAASVAMSILRPGVQLRIPLNEVFRDKAASMLSVSLGIQVP